MSQPSEKSKWRDLVEFTSAVDDLCGGTFTYILNEYDTVKRSVDALRSPGDAGDSHLFVSDRSVLAATVANFGVGLVEKISSFLKGASCTDASLQSDQSDIRVREARDEDWSQITKVHEEAFQQCHIPYLGENCEPWFEPGGKCFVAELQHGDNQKEESSTPDTIAGFVYVDASGRNDGGARWTRGEPFVDDLFVSPRFQRRGIGKMLLRTAERYLEEAGHNVVVLCALEAVPEPHGFYAANGWEIVPDRTFTCAEDGHVYALYRKILPSPGVDGVLGPLKRIVPKNIAHVADNDNSRHVNSGEEEVFSLQHMAGLRLVLELYTLLGIHTLLPRGIVIPPRPPSSDVAGDSGVNDLGQYRTPLEVLSVFPESISTFVEEVLPAMYARHVPETQIHPWLHDVAKGADTTLIVNAVIREVIFLRKLVGRLRLLCVTLQTSGVAQFFLTRFLPDLLSGLLFFRRRRKFLDTCPLVSSSTAHPSSPILRRMSKSVKILDLEAREVSLAASKVARGTHRLEACIRLLQHFQFHSPPKLQSRHKWFPAYVGSVLNKSIAAPGGVAMCVDHMLGHVSKADFSDAFVRVAALLANPGNNFTDTYYKALIPQLVEILRSYIPVLQTNLRMSPTAPESTELRDKLHYVVLLTIDELSERNPVHCTLLLRQLLPVSCSFKEFPTAGEKSSALQAASHVLEKEFAIFVGMVHAFSCRPALASLLLDTLTPIVVAANVHWRTCHPNDVVASDRHNRLMCTDCMTHLARLQAKLSLSRGSASSSSRSTRLLPLWKRTLAHAKSYYLCSRRVEQVKMSSLASVIYVRRDENGALQTAHHPWGCDPELFQTDMVRVWTDLSRILLNAVAALNTSSDTYFAQGATPAADLLLELLEERLRLDLPGVTQSNAHITDDWETLVDASIVEYEEIIGSDTVMQNSNRALCAVCDILRGSVQSAPKSTHQIHLDWVVSHAATLLSLMSLLSALVIRWKADRRKASSASHAQRRFAAIAESLGPSGLKRSTTVKNEHASWVSAEDMGVQMARDATQRLLPELEVLRGVLGVAKEQSAMSSIFEAMDPVVTHVQTLIVTIDSAETVDEDTKSTLPGSRTDDNSSVDRVRRHTMAVQQLLDDVASACKDCEQDCKTLIASTRQGLFEAEPHDRAFAVNEIKLWIIAAFSGRKSTPNANNSKRAEIRLVTSLTKLLLFKLDDNESFVFLRLMDLISTVARHTFIQPVLALVLHQCASRSTEVGLRAKTFQVLEHLVGVSGAMLTLIAPDVVDTVLNVFRMEYSAAQKPAATQGSHRTSPGAKSTRASGRAAAVALSRSAEMASALAASRKRNRLRRLKKLARMRQGPATQEQDDETSLDVTANEQSAMLTQASTVLEQTSIDVADERYVVQIGCISVLGKVCQVLAPDAVPRRPQVLLLFQNVLRSPSAPPQIRRAVAHAVSKFLRHHLSAYRGHVGEAMAARHFYPHSLIAAIKECARNDKDLLTRHYAGLAFDDEE